VRGETVNARANALGGLLGVEILLVLAPTLRKEVNVELRPQIRRHRASSAYDLISGPLVYITCAVILYGCGLQQCRWSAMNDLRDYYRDGDSESDEEDMFDTEEAGAGGDSYITDVSDAQYATDFANDERQPPPYDETSEYLPLPNGRKPTSARKRTFRRERPLRLYGTGRHRIPQCSTGGCAGLGFMSQRVLGGVAHVRVGAQRRGGDFRTAMAAVARSAKGGHVSGGAAGRHVLPQAGQHHCHGRRARYFNPGQSWILTGMVYLAVAVGTEGVLAEAVKIQYLKYSSPALVSVPLGLYIFAWGGLQARTPTARNVMTVYGTAEICKAVGDVLNLFRYITLVHSRQHWSVLLTNEVPRWLATRVEARDLEKLRAEFQHGECGEPHAIILILLVSIAVTTILSFMNVSTVIWRNVSEDAEVAMAKAAASDSSESDEEDPHFAPGTSRLAGSGRRKMPPRSGASSRAAAVPVSEESSRAMIVKMLTRDN
jgi:hypothetical protein